MTLQDHGHARNMQKIGIKALIKLVIYRKIV